MPTKTRSALKSAKAETALQSAIANRVRLTLSLADQRAELPEDRPRIPLVEIADGVARHTDHRLIQSHSGMSRLINGHRTWSPGLLLAFSEWAAHDFRVRVDPGWLAFGAACDASTPEVPYDCRLRDDTTLDGLRRSDRSLREIKQAERRAQSKRAVP